MQQREAARAAASAAAAAAAAAAQQQDGPAASTHATAPPQPRPPLGVARVYADYNEHQPPEYWDYENYRVPWEVRGVDAAAL
jgi:hypothetical protein